MILVDTCVLSLAFRRRDAVRDEGPAVRELRRLIEEDEPVAIPGIVLQELLSGLRDEEQFRKLLRALKGFPCQLASRNHHIAAARLLNRCRAAGVTASAIDCLIAAVCIETGAALLTTDRDFGHIASLSPLRLAPI